MLAAVAHHDLLLYGGLLLVLLRTGTAWTLLNLTTTEVQGWFRAFSLAIRDEQYPSLVPFKLKAFTGEFPPIDCIFLFPSPRRAYLPKESSLLLTKGKKGSGNPTPPTPPNVRNLRSFLQGIEEDVGTTAGVSASGSGVEGEELLHKEKPVLQDSVQEVLHKDVNIPATGIFTAGNQPTAEDVNTHAIATSTAKEAGKQPSAADSGKEAGNNDVNITAKNYEKPVVKKSFVSLFEKNRSEDKGMKLHTVDMAEDDEVFIQPEDITPMEELWGPCLVGCFTGRFPSLAPIQTLVESWKVPCQFLPHHKGWVIFKFLTDADRDLVLHMDDHRINNKKFLLNIPQDGFMWNAKSFSTMPVWVKLDVPLQFWGPNSLSKIASKLGRPLFTDGLTNKVASKLTLEEDPEDKMAYKKPNFCRVLVHMDLSKPPPSSIKVNFVGGNYIQHVEYEDLPLYCYYYEKFGHTPFDCVHLYELEKRKAQEDQKHLDKAKVELLKTTLLAETRAGQGKETRVNQGQHKEGDSGNKKEDMGHNKGDKAAIPDKRTPTHPNPDEPSPSFSKKDDNDGFTLVGKGKGTLTTHPLKPQYKRETRGSGRGQTYGYRGGTYRGGRGPGPNS
ncbi:unnamed protein product [Cuscuta campestris]|uniref:DUF4283 domain-containing protein n=1 Tax=Cuscuta campestris TaxID=132261 RepID=A0A484MXT9_9ASTE|nr:unnamed protein product [Cuscuta campestris]